MRTFIENYLHFMKNCIRPHYEKLKPLKSGFIENSNFENDRDPCAIVMKEQLVHFHNSWTSLILRWAAQLQPHVSCVSWIVQVLLELVILVWCAHVVYCLAESSGYTVLLGGYGDTSTQWVNCRNNHQMLFAFKVIYQTWYTKNNIPNLMY